MDSTQKAKRILQLIQEEAMTCFPLLSEAFGLLDIKDIADINDNKAINSTKTINSNEDIKNVQDIKYTNNLTDTKNKALPVLDTDGQNLYYNANFVCELFQTAPGQLRWMFLHLHLHCICEHPFRIKEQDHADILVSVLAYLLVESQIKKGGILSSSVRTLFPVPIPLKEYLKKIKPRELTSAVFHPQKLLEALKISPGSNIQAESRAISFESDIESVPFAISSESELESISREVSSESELKAISREVSSKSDFESISCETSPELNVHLAFRSDTHEFWPVNRNDKKSIPSQAKVTVSDYSEPGKTKSVSKSDSLESFLFNKQLLYQKLQKSLLAEMEHGFGKRGWAPGSAAEEADLKMQDSMDYHSFLQRFTVPREEALIDTDSFDYIPYHYGLTYYGNLPFIEPLEYKEVNRLDELAIAIDTSASCSGRIVRRFLEETWSILRQKENFFSRMRLHLIQCDSMIQEYRIFTSVKEWEEAIPNFQVLGFGNTDFCPVFELLEKQIAAGEIRQLRGLLYFTDGDGIFPRSAPSFDTAFVFLNQATEKHEIPDWGIRLNLNLPEEF